MTLSVTSLFSVETAATLLDKGFAVAQALGLPVTSWRAGDPTRSLYHYMAEILGAFEGTAANYIKAGFLSSATGDWLEVLAKEVYNVDKQQATAAAAPLTLTNTGGGFYEWDAGDLTFKASVTQKTYHSTSALSLGPGESGVVSWEADEAGSDYSVAEDEIDELVTTALGVEITSSEAAVANDAQTDDSLRETCLASIGMLSPNGPADAYRFVATTSALTGTTEVTRASVVADDDTGDVTVYIAGSAAAVSDPSRVLVEDAIAEWATPLCITPTVISATAVSFALGVTVYIRDTVNMTSDAVEEAIEDAVAALAATIKIGGNAGFLHLSLLVATIKAVFPDHIYNVIVNSPFTNVALSASQFPVLAAAPTIAVVFT